MTGGARPPRLARALLEWLLPAGDPGAVTGDLDEEYTRHVRPDRGRLAADLWYWRQVLLSAPRLLGRRVGLGADPVGSLVGDVRFAMRVLRRRPGFTLAAAATLALGLGANTTVFSVVNAVLVQPLPFENEDRLVRLIPGQLFYIDSREALLIEERMTSLESFAAWGRTLFLFSDESGAEEVRGARVSWNHFDMLGVQPLLGRTFVREDAEVDDAVVLGHGLWERRFGGDPAVVGSTVELYGRGVTVVGVLRPDHVPMEYDWQAWRTIPLDPQRTAGSGMAGNGRLRDGVTLEQARDELRRVLPEIWAEGGYVASDEERAGLELEPLRTWLVGDVQQALLVLGAAVAFVLLLACVNVASLVLAQSSARRTEFAVRTALGGARGRLVRQVLVEVLLLGALGGALALLVSTLSLGWFRARLPATMPRLDEIAVSGPVVAFTVLATLVVALVSGALPAWKAASGGLSSETRGSRGASAGPDRLRVRGALVAAEVAIAVVLVVGAGLMIRTLVSLRGVDPGFDVRGVVTVRPSPPSDRYPEGPELAAYYDELAATLAALPGAESVGAIQFLPMTPGGWWGSYLPEGRVLASGESEPNTAMRVIREGYFETMRIPVRTGRSLEAADGDAGEPYPVVVNESFAREAFGAVEDAAGRSVTASGTRVNIVGVVADVRQSDLRTTSHAEMYVMFEANPWRRMHMVVRFDGDAGSATSAVSDAVRGIDAGVTILGPRPMAEVVGATLGDARLVTSLLTLFGIVGLGLGAVGVYGVTAQSVNERRREIGIRLALGAEASGVTRRTVLRGLRPVVVGVAAGLVGARVGGRFLEGLLFDVAATDPTTLLVAPSILVAVAVLALVVPALRASRVDPVRTLREE